MEYSVIAPVVVMRPTTLAVPTNHRFPSGPAVMPAGPVEMGRGNWVVTPAVVILQMLLPLPSLNQRLPSGPVVMPIGCDAPGTGNSVITPAGVIRPIW